VWRRAFESSSAAAARPISRSYSPTTTESSSSSCWGTTRTTTGTGKRRPIRGRAPYCVHLWVFGLFVRASRRGPATTHRLLCRCEADEERESERGGGPSCAIPRLKNHELGSSSRGHGLVSSFSFFFLFFTSSVSLCLCLCLCVKSFCFCFCFCFVMRVRGGLTPPPSHSPALAPILCLSLIISCALFRRTWRCRRPALGMRDGFGWLMSWLVSSIDRSANNYSLSLSLSLMCLKNYPKK
jgi:hypothetical protein